MVDEWLMSGFAFRGRYVSVGASPDFSEQTNSIEHSLQAITELRPPAFSPIKTKINPSCFGFL